MDSEKDHAALTDPFGPIGELTAEFSSELDLDTQASGSGTRPARAEPGNPPPVTDGDRYQLRGFLGQGGVGQVFEALDLNLERRVALKFLHGHLQGEAERLLREGRAQALIEHPHVVKIFEAGELQGHAYLAMQLVPGRSLQEVAVTLPMADRLRVLMQACFGVQAAHFKGLMHRDLKPGNILVEIREDGRPHAFVTDFGMARLGSGESNSSGALEGTPAYMSPEQIRREPMDERSDVYALGCCLYMLITGAPPFEAATVAGLIRKVLEQVPPSPKLKVPDLSEDLDAIARRCLAKDPGQRYPSAKALAEDLGRYLNGQPVQARPINLTERARKWLSRNPATAILGGLALAIALASAATVVWTWKRAEAQSRHAIHFNDEAQDLVQALLAIRNLPRDPDGAEMAKWWPRFQAMQAEAAGARGLARAPAQASLGQVLLVLEQWEGARRAFQKSADLGYRPPEVQLGLGTALAGLDLEEGMGVALLPQALAAREQERLKASYVDPARRLLQQSRATSGNPELVEARILAAEERYPEALRKVDAVLAGSPWLVVARHLQCQILARQVAAAAMPGAADGLDPLLPGALAALAQGRDLARNDPAFLVREAEIRGSLVSLAHKRGSLDADLLEAALAPARQALAMDPRLTDALAVQATAWTQWGEQLGNQGRDPLATYRLSQAACRRALAIDPTLAWPHQVQLMTEFGLASAACRPGSKVGTPAEHARLAERHFAEFARLVSGARADLASLTLAQTLYFEADATMDAGLDPRVPLENAVALADRAKGANRDWLVPALFHTSMLIELSRLDPDPNPLVLRACAELEALRRQFPRNGLITLNLAINSMQKTVWETQHPGQDPEPALRAIEALARELPEYAPGLADRAQEVLAWSACVRLEWAVGQGQDGKGLLAEARRAIAKLPSEAREQFLQFLANLEIQADLWAGKSPRGPLQKLEAELGKSPAGPERDRLLADAMLAHAKWALATGQDPAAELAKAEKLLSALWQSPLWENRRRACDAMIQLQLLRDRAGRPEALAAAQALLKEARGHWPDFTRLELFDGLSRLRQPGAGQEQIQAALKADPALAAEARFLAGLLNRR